MLTNRDIIPDDFNYKDHFINNKFDNLLGLENKIDNISEKVVYDPIFRVQRNNKVPLAPELDDLCRLHYISISRKVTTILEFGVGKSSVILAHALSLNKANNYEFTHKSLRRKNLYELHSIDNFEEWIDECKKIMPNKYIENGIANFHFAKLDIGLFCDRICSYYDPIPNLCPDLIYLDAPYIYSDTGNIRGISTNHQDRMPMAADILAFEHFLQPGTLIIVDGRTANARFLKCNLQRQWAYFHSSEWDQHFFELQEEPLGIYNNEMIKHCLGGDYFKRIYK